MIETYPVRDLDIVSRVSDDQRVVPGVTVRHVRSRTSFGTVVSVTNEGATVLWTQRPIIVVQPSRFQEGQQLSQREIDSFNWTVDTIEEAMSARVVADVETEVHSNGRTTWNVKAWPQREDYDMYQRGMTSKRRF